MEKKRKEGKAKDQIETGYKKRPSPMKHLLTFIMFQTSVLHLSCRRLPFTCHYTTHVIHQNAHTQTKPTTLSSHLIHIVVKKKKKKLPTTSRYYHQPSPLLTATKIEKIRPNYSPECSYLCRANELCFPNILSH